MNDFNETAVIIPNLEIRDIFETQIVESFKENVREDGEMLNRFCDALQNKDAENVEKISSNREMGEGYADILAEPDTGHWGYGDYHRSKICP